MTAKGILDAAYKAGIVPEHLHGTTQHKTLQARLSEDILHRRSTSQFFRTEPGYFFLTELISDTEIPDKYKEPFPARRRTRDLRKDPILTLEVSFIESRTIRDYSNWNEFIVIAHLGSAGRLDGRYLSAA